MRLPWDPQLSTLPQLRCSFLTNGFCWSYSTVLAVTSMFLTARLHSCRGTAPPTRTRTSLSGSVATNTASKASKAVVTMVVI